MDTRTDQPETAEEPGAALDGEPTNGGRSVADQAIDDAPLAPEPPAIAPDTDEKGQQLSFSGVMPRRVPIEDVVVIQSRSFDGGGLLDPEKEGQLLISYRFAKYVFVPVREHGKVVRWKREQHVIPVYGMKPDQWPDFVKEQEEFAAEEREADQAIA